MAGGSDSIIKIGPFGTYNPETIWDGKGHSNIVQIFVSHKTDSINSIQYQYVENGNLMLSDLFGTQSYGYKYDTVTLNYPKEYITCIRGYTVGYGVDLCSITFGTNLGEYGPFGTFEATNDTEFNMKLGGNQFFGFHGSTENGCVNSIGVYMKLNKTLNLVKKEK